MKKRESPRVEPHAIQGKTKVTLNLVIYQRPHSVLDKNMRASEIHVLQRERHFFQRIHNYQRGEEESEEKQEITLKASLLRHKFRHPTREPTQQQGWKHEVPHRKRYMMPQNSKRNHQKNNPLNHENPMIRCTTRVTLSKPILTPYPNYTEDAKEWEQ